MLYDEDHTNRALASIFHPNASMADMSQRVIIIIFLNTGNPMFKLTKLGHSISKEKYECRPWESLMNSYLQGCRLPCT